MVEPSFMSLFTKQLQNTQGISLDASRIYKAISPTYEVISVENRNNPIHRCVISLEEENKKQEGIWAKIKAFFSKIVQWVKNFFTKIFNWFKNLFKAKGKKKAEEVDNALKKTNKEIVIDLRDTSDSKPTAKFTETEEERKTRQKKHDEEMSEVLGLDKDFDWDGVRNSGKSKSKDDVIDLDKDDVGTVMKKATSNNTNKSNDTKKPEPQWTDGREFRIKKGGVMREGEHVLNSLGMNEIMYLVCNPYVFQSTGKVEFSDWYDGAVQHIVDLSEDFRNMVVKRPLTYLKGAKVRGDGEGDKHIPTRVMKTLEEFTNKRSTDFVKDKGNVFDPSAFKDAIYEGVDKVVWLPGATIFIAKDNKLAVREPSYNLNHIFKTTFIINRKTNVTTMWGMMLDERLLTITKDLTSLEDLLKHYEGGDKGSASDELLTWFKQYIQAIAKVVKVLGKYLQNSVRVVNKMTEELHSLLTLTKVIV